MVAAQQRLALFIDDLQRPRRFGEFQHVAGHLGHAGQQRGLVILFQVGLRPVRIIFAVGITLQLAAPDAAEIHIACAIIIGEDGGIDRIAALDRLRLRLERPHRILRRCNADAEHAFLVLGREVEIISAILTRGVGCPHLAIRPRHILDVQRHWPDRYRPADLVHRQHAIVAHLEMAAKIILGGWSVDIVAGVNIDFAIPDMGGRVGGIDVLDQRLGQIFRSVCGIGGWRLRIVRALLAPGGQQGHRQGQGSEQYPSRPGHQSLLHVSIMNSAIISAWQSAYWILCPSIIAAI